MSAKGKGIKTYQPAPVRQIELSDQHKTGRLVLVVVLLVIAGIAFYIAIKDRVSANAGWQAISAITTDANCSDEITLTYNVGAGGGKVQVEYKAVTALYSDAAVKAYRIFQAEQEFDDVGNLALVNHHPNETVTVDPVLYRALEMIAESGDRRIYLGPLYRQYRIIYECESDGEAMDADPNRDPELKAFAGELAALAADPEAIDLKLLGNDHVRLEVGEAYMELIAVYGDAVPLDLGRLKNALAADYLADRFAEQGLTAAIITSKDGFARSICEGVSLDSIVYSLQGTALYPAAALTYTAPMSLVCFRNYPSAAGDGQGYIYEDGTIVTDWISAEDGLNRTSLPELLCLDPDKTCAQLLLENEDLFTAERFDEARLSCGAVWTEGTTVCTHGEGFTVSELLEGETIKFTLR